MIGYHISHEQFDPAHLLKLVQMAQEAGFDGALSSDHFNPWSEKQGHSALAWVWLGAAMQATSIPFGIVNAPGYRYHPAIIAQGAATLESCFPGRFWIALGTGQALNESILGQRWPDKQARKERLLECVEIMSKLWAGETVSHRGQITVENAKIYTLPKKPPLVFGAAISVETAEWVGGWAQGLITINHPKEKLEKVVEAFRRCGGENKPMYLKVQLSFDRDENEALKGAHDQWRTVILDSSVNTELRNPSQFDAAAQFISPEQMRDHVLVSSSANQFVDWIGDYRDMGFSNLILHNVNLRQEPFFEMFASRVLPQIKG